MKDILNSLKIGRNTSLIKVYPLYRPLLKSNFYEYIIYEYMAPHILYFQLFHRLFQAEILEIKERPGPDFCQKRR